MASSHLSEHDAARAAGLRASLDEAGMTSCQLWAEALNLGGFFTPGQVGEFLAGRRVLSDHEHAVLGQALFEALALIPTR